MRPTARVAVTPRRTGVLAYLRCIRYKEVLVLQGSPLLGAAFARPTLTLDNTVVAGLMAAASVLLVAHIWSFNDWAGAALDVNDPNRSADVFTTRGVSRRGLAGLSVGLLGASLSLLALLPRQTLLLGLVIALLGGLYSHPAFNAKGTAVVSSLPHLIGGALHFLLGYSVFTSIDSRGMLLALFFALTFTAGHLNQEVGDHEGDRLNGIRTNAVVFGKEAAFAAGFVLFTLAYADLAFLAWARIVPVELGLLALVLYPIHVVWSITTLRAGLDFASVSRFRTRYRLLYALIGVAMVVTLVLR
jgi:4-hydroxybenzoate polyprenyltransferase